MYSIEEWVKEEQAKQSKNSHGRGKKNAETYIEDWNNGRSCENLDYKWQMQRFEWRDKMVDSFMWEVQLNWTFKLESIFGVQWTNYLEIFGLSL